MLFVTPEYNRSIRVSEPSTKEFLANYMKEFHAFIVRVLTVLPRSS